MIPPTDLLDFGALCLGESQWSSPGSLCPSLWFPNSAPLIAVSFSRIVAVLDGPIDSSPYPSGMGSSQALAPSSIQVTSPHPTPQTPRVGELVRSHSGCCAQPQQGSEAQPLQKAHHIHGFSSTLSRPQSKWLVEESSSIFFLSTAHPATVAGPRTATTVPTKQLTSSAAVPPRRD